VISIRRERAGTAEPLTTVFLVRHAEKGTPPPNDPDNPPLSNTGRQRAKELAQVLGDVGVKAIFASQFVRTQQTAQPLATMLGIPVQKPAIAPQELANRIRADYAGQVVLVTGHSNTVPKVIEALGGGTMPDIEDAEFDNLYVVTIHGTDQVKVLRLKYGKH